MKIAKYPDLRELKGLLRKKDFSYSKIAKLLGIGANAFNDKINGFNAFKTPEIQEMVKILEIDPANVPLYFFPDLLKPKQED